MHMYIKVYIYNHFIRVYVIIIHEGFMMATNK